MGIPGCPPNCRRFEYEVRAVRTKKKVVDLGETGGNVAIVSYVISDSNFVCIKERLRWVYKCVF